MQKIKCLSEINLLIEQLPKPNQEIIKEAKEYQNQLTKPQGSLGILEDLSIFFCGWQNNIKPSLKKIQTLIFAGNHGVCNQGVNSYPQSVTSEMVLNFKNGGAAINQLCAHSSVNLQVIPIDLDNPTNDIYFGPAMNETELLVSINKGIEAVNKKSDLIVLGEMGIGNSTKASAISSACFGGSIEKWVGRGTANNDNKLLKKISVIRKSLKVNKKREPLKILMSLGGREQAAIFGATLAARMLKIPVIMDGFICSASAAPLFLLDNSSLDHCIFGHCSMEKGHKLLLKSMNKSPLLNLNMHLGEGSGAMIALNIVRSALVCHNGMASFESAGVSNSK
jgi:nicotinate-nucleotide--dimethylbenzimidazole phosphoribosyltransferase